MDKKAICDLQKRRKELLDLGLCCSIIGPTARCNKSSIYIFKW